MFIFLTSLALAESPVAVDPIPFQRGGVASAVPLTAGQGTVELGTALVDQLLTSSDTAYSDVSATVAVSDRVSVFGNAQLFQDLTYAEFLGSGTPRFATVGGRVIAFESRTVSLAPWVSIDGGTPLFGDGFGDELGAQFGLAFHYQNRKLSLDASAPLARVVFDTDPIDLERSAINTYSDFSFSTTYQVDEHHGLRAGMESILPYISYRYTSGAFSVEPVVGIPFVGVRGGFQF